MRARVYKIVSQVLDVPESEITDDSSSDTIESWDSLTIEKTTKDIELELELEEELDI